MEINSSRYSRQAANKGSVAIETGWATQSGQTLASATPGYNSATRHTLGTDAGRNFAAFLGSLKNAGGGVQLSPQQQGHNDSEAGHQLDGAGQEPGQVEFAQSFDQG